MKSLDIIKEFEHIAENLNIRIIHEKGNFKGGYCILEEEPIIVVNLQKPIEQRIRSLVQVFSRMDTSDIFLKPAIRQMIELKDNSLQLSSTN